jgi:hypothetical protein
MAILIHDDNGYDNYSDLNEGDDNISEGYRNYNDDNNDAVVIHI